jgi:hypothetical protein
MRLTLLVVVLALLGVQEPDYIGPEDPAHEGQPRTCTNTPHRKAVKHDCPCVKTTCDPDANMEDAKCYVYCRKPACKCSHGCESE